MVSFNDIPTALRVPFVSVEVDSSRAASGPGVQPLRALLIGQKLNSAPAVANSLHRVTSADAVATLAGRGSMLQRQALAWFAFNKSTETWIGVLADNSAAVVAEGSVTLAGTATEAGTISFYLGGNLVQVAVASGDSAATVAAALATEIGKHATGTVTMATAIAGSNVTIGATTFVGTVGAVVAGAATYSVDTSNDAAATSLAAQVNAHAVASLYVRASAASAVVTLRYIGQGDEGDDFVLTSTGATVAVSGAGTLTAGVAGENPDLPMNATVSSAVVTLRANNAGAVGNDIDLRVNYRSDSEETPAGLTVALVQPTGGATNPTLTSLIAAMGDDQYNVIAHPYVDATSLTAIENELSSRFGPMRQIDGHAFTAASGTHATDSTLGDTRNSQHSTIIRIQESPTPAFEVAAHVAGVAAYHLQIDPARPLQTLALPYVLAPALADRDTLSERNLSLYDGISTIRVGGGDLVQIERLITTNQTNAAGSPSTAYLSVETMFSIAYARADFRSRMATKYPRHKLGSDSTNYPAGEAIMTPSLGKAEAVSWFLDMSTASPVVFDPGALAQFKEDLVVEINASNGDRLDFLLPPDLIGKLITTAAQVQFRT